MFTVHRSSPSRHRDHERRRRPAHRWAIVAVLTLGVVVPVSACRPAERPGGDEVSGPEWNTAVRRSPGAATEISPATLTGLSIQAYEAYDRVVFDFDGDRPGYRVAYEERAGGSVLRVTLDHIDAPTDRRLAPRAKAVREVVQYPARNLVIDAVVEITPAEGDARQPFRVGLDVGEFSVDISHPDEVAAARVTG